MKQLKHILWYLGNLQIVLCWPNVRSTDSSEEWTGRWFPDRPSARATVPKLDVLVHHNHNRTMGIKDICDDAKTNLDVDNPRNMKDYLCMSPRSQIWPDPSLAPTIEFQNIPAAYVAEHLCMNESIEYDTTIPTFGTHRQLWSIYGEYTFLPAQRWIHNLEHGGIVALYHPCADSRSIKIFKNTVTSCLRRHAITPWPKVGQKQAFALVAWGVRLRMSNVDVGAMRQFIQEHALQGPEKLSDEGQFSDWLIKKADVVSDYDDSQLCPQPLAHD